MTLVNNAVETRFRGQMHPHFTRLYKADLTLAGRIAALLTGRVWMWSYRADEPGNLHLHVGRTTSSRTVGYRMKCNE